MSVCLLFVCFRLICSSSLELQVQVKLPEFKSFGFCSEKGNLSKSYGKITIELSAVINLKNNSWFFFLAEILLSRSVNNYFSISAGD